MHRLEGLAAGHKRWAEDRKSKRLFPGGAYVLLHTLSHLLIQSLAMRCGYPASSIRERIYADTQAERFGILLYTGSPDADGTLGGLVQQARHFEDHLAKALRQSALCSNDPICAQHAPGKSMEERWLHGAACHGCALVAETSLRDAQRLPRPRARRASAWRTGRRVLRGSGVTDGLLNVPPHLRERLACALESGVLHGSPSQAALRSVLGSSEEMDPIASALAEFTRLGIGGAGAAAWLRSMNKLRANTPQTDLVWSGPAVPGLHARDTRRVYEELLGSAVRSLWVSTYAFFDGPRVFEVLARRMQEAAGLQVSVLLNIQRKRRDTTVAEQLVRRFTDRFWGVDWPGAAPASLL